MSVASVLVRLLVALCVLCVAVSGQSSSSSAAAAASSSSSGRATPSSSSSVSSSSGASGPVSGNQSSSSMMSVSSSSSSMVAGVYPVILSLSGCNGTAINNMSTMGLTSCDGQSGVSLINVLGSNFTATSIVQVECSGQTYQLTLVGSAAPSLIMCNTPQIDKMYANSDCKLYVVNDGGLKSNGMTIQFSSWASDIEEAFKLLGMSLMTVIVIAVVIGIVILVATILCTLACCCGVSLAFLNCCRSRSTTVVLSPQSSGYSSME